MVWFNIPVDGLFYHEQGVAAAIFTGAPHRCNYLRLFQNFSFETAALNLREKVVFGSLFRKSVSSVPWLVPIGF
jgi:hypothetical protein